MNCDNTDIIKEKIYIIPYIVHNSEKSIVLEKLVDDEWSVISDHFDMQDFKYTIINKVEHIIKNEIIYNFITILIVDIIKKMKNKTNVEEFNKMIKIGNLDTKIKNYVDYLLISELMNLLKDTKIYDILSIWKNEEVSFSYNVTTSANIEQYSQLSIPIEKI